MALLLGVGVGLAVFVLGWGRCGAAGALVVALAVALVLLVALAEAEGELLDLAWLALDFGVLAKESEATSRTTADWLAGTERAAEVVAGGWPHTLGADAPTALTSAALTVLASAAVPPRRPMLEVTMAAPATMPKADDCGTGRFHGRAFVAMVIFVETSRVL